MAKTRALLASTPKYSSIAATAFRFSLLFSSPHLTSQVHFGKEKKKTALILPGCYLVHLTTAVRDETHPHLRGKCVILNNYDRRQLRKGHTPRRSSSCRRFHARFWLRSTNFPHGYRRSFASQNYCGHLSHSQLENSAPPSTFPQVESLVAVYLMNSRHISQLTS